MANKPQADAHQEEQIHILITEPRGSGGLQEFIHALAAILARIDSEQRHPVQSSPSPASDTERKEEAE